jgi:hypothetical protein
LLCTILATGLAAAVLWPWVGRSYALANATAARSATGGQALLELYALVILSLISSALLGASAALVATAIRSRWLSVLGGVLLALGSPLLGSFAVYTWVYRGEPPGMHVNIGREYRAAPFVATVGALGLGLILAHRPHRGRETDEPSTRVV